MAGLADWLEDYRNWRGRQEWEQGKGWQDFFGGDPRAQEQLEKLSGFGTDAGGLVGMIKASHGSPHAFTKFDFSKIGTGEGAQAYGHGGYFAQGFDSPVAKEYRDALAGVEVGGKVMTPEWDSPYYYPLQALRKHGDDIEKARADVYERNKNIPGGWPEELVAFEDAVKQGIKRNQGHLYNVELRWPDPAREAADPLGEHHLLDWDAPLAEQPEYVRKALSGLNDKYVQEALSSKPKSVDDGDYWKYLGNTYDSRRDALEDVTPMQLITGSRGSFKSPKDASEQLKALGIPGIRYLDQASRNAGKGTRNYVMFDDALANIVSRNGVSLSDLLQNPQQLKSLNPTGSVFAKYNPTARASLPLGENLTTLSETMGVSPDELITIYRGVPHDVSTINPGDFITTNQQLAKDYAGTGKVISQKVKASDILDDLNESLGEEYIYRPGLKKLLKK